VIAALGDDFPIPPEFIAAFRGKGIPVLRSPERALRALAHATAYGKTLRAAGATAPAISAPPLSGHGSLAEHQGKAYLAALGIAVPDGALAHDISAAKEIAARVGYPVALKAQSATLTHKSDAGGVVLDIADAAALGTAWRRIAESVAGNMLDGMLVEAMAPPGVEMIVGAKRDPGWGPVVLVGLGGIWTEALDDVRLIPADLAREQVIDEIGRLKGARLLQGLRGSAPVDVGAVADVALRVGALMRVRPEISEIDINPLVAYPDRVLALDALIVTAEKLASPA
jgi:acyl-CoA synthetase (NDP forming)